jgi:hypothetical protein
MQIYANVAADPVWTPAKTEGLKGCWQFRAGEAFKEKDGQQQESTWYTVKDYGTDEHETPRYSKGDFLKILGRLKPAAWMNRAGKPDATLYVHAFDISVERKVGQKTVAKVETPGRAPEPVRQVAVATKMDAQAVPAPTAVEAVPATTGSKLVSAVKGLFQGSVEDAPDWGLV